MIAKNASKEVEEGLAINTSKVTLSTSWSYATSLVLIHLNDSSSVSSSGPSSPIGLHVLPPGSTVTIAIGLGKLLIEVDLVKVSAHSVDSLAISAYSYLQSTFTPLAFSSCPMRSSESLDILFFDSFHSWIFCFGYVTYSNHAAIYLYSPEDLNHLRTCPYISPDLNSCSTHRNEITKFWDACIVSFSSLKSLPDLFQDEFSALNCWNFVAPSQTCAMCFSMLEKNLKEFLPH
ncbi:unnamed protein product [Rhizophagus irregularis]|nr:unnamed protein product [Rhizophagus irregularis]